MEKCHYKQSFAKLITNALVQIVEHSTTRHYSRSNPPIVGLPQHRFLLAADNCISLYSRSELQGSIELGDHVVERSPLLVTRRAYNAFDFIDYCLISLTCCSAERFDISNGDLLTPHPLQTIILGESLCADAVVISRHGSTRHVGGGRRFTRHRTRVRQAIA